MELHSALFEWNHFVFKGQGSISCCPNVSTYDRWMHASKEDIATYHHIASHDEAHLHHGCNHYWQSCWSTSLVRRSGTMATICSKDISSAVLTCYWPWNACCSAGCGQKFCTSGRHHWSELIGKSIAVTGVCATGTESWRAVLAYAILNILKRWHIPVID